MLYEVITELGNRTVKGIFNEEARERVKKSQQIVDEITTSDRAVYGIRNNFV